MPATCAADGCINKGKIIDGVTYHRFPQDPDLRQKWIDAVNRENWTLRTHSKICSSHFREVDIDRNSLCRVRLRDGAVPMIFHKLPEESQVTQVHPLKRKIESEPCSSNSNLSPTKELESESEESDKKEYAPKKRRKGARKELDYSLLKGSHDTCCALACTNTSESHLLTSLPQDAENRQKWISKIDRQDWTPSETSALCEIHFEADAWEEDAKGERVLKTDVLPTLYLHGEAIKSWVTLDSSGNVENVLLRKTTGSEDNVDVTDKGTSVYIKEEAPADIDDSMEKDTGLYIKQEILEPDIEMMEETSDVEEPFETVYCNSDIGKPDYRDIIKTENISIKSLTQIEPETILPEITHVNIKTEIMEEEEEDGSEETNSETWNCVECCETFEERWTVEQHVLDKHSDSERAKLLRKKTNDTNVSKKSGNLKSSAGSPSVVTVSLTPSVINSKATTSSDATTQNNINQIKPSLVLPTAQSASSFVAPTASQGDQPSPKQFLVLIPQSSSLKHPMYLPLAKSSPTHTVVSSPSPPPSQPQLPSATSAEPMYPSCTTDSSETFSISLAHFPEATRLAIKKKLMEVIDTVEKLKVNPEMIVIARKAPEIKPKL